MVTFDQAFDNTKRDTRLSIKTKLEARGYDLDGDLDDSFMGLQEKDMEAAGLTLPETTALRHVLAKITGGAGAGASTAAGAASGSGPAGAGAGAGAAAGDELLKNFQRLLEESQSKILSKLEDSRNVVSAGALHDLEHSMFAIIADKPARRPPEQHVCAGIFFREPGVAATADHCLPKSAKVGDKVKVRMMATGEKLKLTITTRNTALDYALLWYEMPSNAGLDTPGMTFLKVYPNADTLRHGTSLALCTCSITLSKEVGDIDDTGEPKFAVMPAAAIRQSSKKHHLIYACQTLSGDCGSALVLHNGMLVGLHVMGVNELQERISHARTLEERLSAVEESLDSAIASVASGSIALLASEMKPAE